MRHARETEHRERNGDPPTGEEGTERPGPDPPAAASEGSTSPREPDRPAGSAVPYDPFRPAEELPESADDEGGAGGEGPARAEDGVGREDIAARIASTHGFAPDVFRFLGVLSQAVQQHSMYPPGHPALGTVVGSVMDALLEALEGRTVLSLGVASRQLAVEGAESPSGHPRLAFLAGRLHRHRLASVTFESGITASEVAEFLARVGREPDLDRRPLGQAPPEDQPGWPHLRIQPIRYERFRLAGAPDGRGAEEDGEDAPRSARLWLGLARAALVTDATESDAEEGSADQGGADGDARTTDRTAVDAGPAHGAASFADEEGQVVELARSVEEFATESTYAQEVLEHLVSISRELREADAPEAEELRRRASRLVTLVRPDALRDVLRSGGDATERRQLLLNASQWMEPGSVVKLVQATAGVERHDLSHGLLLMMTKLARHAESGSGGGQREAEVGLRSQVAELLDDWALEGAVPEGYGDALERMSRASRPTGGAPEAVAGVVEAERVVQMSLEADATGPAVWEAVDALLEERVSELVGWLAEAPEESRAAEEIWERVACPEVVRRILDDASPDFEALDRVLARLGARAAEPMLRTLADSDSRAVRRRLFSRLARLGSDAAPHVVRRLETDSRWFVKRNMLALLGEYEIWPPKWSPASYIEHRHPAVRREAMKLMLRVPSLRDAAVTGLLEDRDARAVALGIAAAQESAPPDAANLLLSLAEDEALRTDLRVGALRAYILLRRPDALDVLLDQALRPAPWPLRIFGRRRIADKSALVLEALAGLYRTWRDHPRAARALARAARSEDPEIRAAARGEVAA